MDQLIEGVLAVGSRLAPVDGPGLVVDLGPVERDVLAVALHRQLLQIGREALQVLLVGQDRHGLRAEEIVVPDGQQPHEHRQVALERRGAEMLVHLVEAIEHGAEVIRPDGQHGRKADGRIHRIAAARPSPRTRTCWPCRCRTRTPLRHWSKRPQNAWPRPFIAAQALEQTSRARCGRWSSSPGS